MARQGARHAATGPRRPGRYEPARGSARSVSLAGRSLVRSSDRRPRVHARGRTPRLPADGRSPMVRRCGYDDAPSPAAPLTVGTRLPILDNRSNDARLVTEPRHPVRRGAFPCPISPRSASRARSRSSRAAGAPWAARSRRRSPAPARRSRSPTGPSTRPRRPPSAIRAAGGEAIGIAGDATDEADAERAVATTRRAVRAPRHHRQLRRRRRRRGPVRRPLLPARRLGLDHGAQRPLGGHPDACPRCGR